MKNAEIFQNARLVRVRLQEVDDRDRTFALCWPGERGVEELAAEIGTSGVIAPVWVAGEEKGGGYLLVDGFRRVAAARRAGIEILPAELLPGDLDQVKLFRARLAGQGARLSAVEASKVLEKLKTRFRVGESTLVETFLPLLGLGRARPLLEQCLGLSALEEPVARYCAENRVGLAEAALWAGLPAGSQRAVLDYVSALRPGANLLRNYLRLLAGIALCRGTTVEEVLQDKGLRRLLRDPQTARSGGRELMHKRLHELRYPQMHRIGERFESARRDLGLSQEVSLLPPPSFEGGRLRLTFEVESPRDLEARARELLDSARSGKLQELFRCLGAPAGRARGEAEGEQGDQEL